MTVSISHPFRIMSSGRAVGTIRATDREAALAAFMAGRRLPDAVELSAYRIIALPPRGARGYRA